MRKQPDCTAVSTAGQSPQRQYGVGQLESITLNDKAVIPEVANVPKMSKDTGPPKDFTGPGLNFKPWPVSKHRHCPNRYHNYKIFTVLAMTVQAYGAVALVVAPQR